MAYTPPPSDQLDFDLESYSPPSQDNVAVDASSARSMSLQASASGSASATIDRDRPVTAAVSASGTIGTAISRPRFLTHDAATSGTLDADAEGPITGFHLLDDFRAASSLDSYTGQNASFALDSTNPIVAGTNVLTSGGTDVGITHTGWTLRYGARNRFWLDPAGNFAGLYIGSTQGGLSTGDMEGIGVGADANSGSLDIVNISGGTWDYDRFVDAPISSGAWHQFEVIVEDPSVSGSQIILRLLDDKGQTVTAEVTRPATTFTGVSEPVIGVVAAASGARVDKLETDDRTTLPGHWVSMHASASGTASAAVTKDREISAAPSVSGALSTPLTNSRTVGIAAGASGDGTVNFQRGDARSFLYHGEATGTGSAAVTKTTARSIVGRATATAAVSVNKSRAATYAGSGSAAGTLPLARERTATLAGTASGSLAAAIDPHISLSLAARATGHGRAWVLRGPSAPVVSTRTLIGRAVESTPTQIGEFTRATPRLAGTVAESSPQLKGRVIEATPELTGRAVREHPPIVGTLIRD